MNVWKTLACILGIILIAAACFYVDLCRDYRKLEQNHRELVIRLKDAEHHRDNFEQLFRDGEDRIDIERQHNATTR